MGSREHHGSGDTRRRCPTCWFDDGIDIDASYELIISVFRACSIPLLGVVSQVGGQGPLFWTDDGVVDPDSRDA